MTSLELKERQRFARSRAGQIRQGMRTYIETLGVIATAYREQDHLTLGYPSWDEYLAKEFDHVRLQLDPEMREKAIVELRLAGLSQRAIGTTLGVGLGVVNRTLAGVPGGTPDEILGADGKAYAAKSPLVEAMTEAIEDAERSQDRRDDTPGDPDEPVGPAGPGAAPEPSTGVEASGTGTSPVPDAPSDADLHAQLDAEMAGTAVRFRAQFSAAVAKADDVWQFDVDRVAEVYAGDFDREIGPFLTEMRAWCDRLERTHRRLNSGLRVVG